MNPRPIRDCAAFSAPSAHKAAQSRIDEPGRLLVGVYAVFTVAAGARSAVQLSTAYSTAPLAYTLSAVAGVVYLVGTVALRRPSLHRLALLSVLLEGVSVVAVGTLSVVRPSMFADATVWSAYGMGYGFVPLVLPVLALVWLRAGGASRAARPARGRASRTPPARSR